MNDTFKTMKCPACQKEMAKIFVPHEGVNIDICLDGCGGIYFDNREYEYFDEPHEDIDPILDSIKGKTFTPVDESLPRTCPACGARMVKHFASGKQAVQIDACYSCGGKFLDHGELEKIRAEYKTKEERDTASIDLLYELVGDKLREHEAETARAKASLSWLRRLWDKMLGY